MQESCYLEPIVGGFFAFPPAPQFIVSYRPKVHCSSETKACVRKTKDLLKSPVYFRDAAHQGFSK